MSASFREFCQVLLLAIPLLGETHPIRPYGPCGRIRRVIPSVRRLEEGPRRIMRGVVSRATGRTHPGVAQRTVRCRDRTPKSCWLLGHGRQGRDRGRRLIARERPVLLPVGMFDLGSWWARTRSRQPTKNVAISSQRSASTADRWPTHSSGVRWSATIGSQRRLRQNTASTVRKPPLRAIPRTGCINS